MNTPMALNKIYHKNKDFWTPPQTNTMTKLGEYLRASFPTANLSDNTESLKEFDIFVLLPGKNFVISDLLNFCEPKNPVGLIVDEQYKAEVSVWQRNIKSDKIFLSNLFFISDLKNMIGLIASAFYSNPSKKLNITAVTGTNGKTTFVNACANIVANISGISGYIGTLGAGIFKKKTGAIVAEKLSAFGLTTPSAITLQRILNFFQKKGVKDIFIEASSIGIVEGRLIGCQIESAVFTNLGHDHLDFHGSILNLAKAKALLFSSTNLKNVICPLQSTSQNHIKQEKIIYDQIYKTSNVISVGVNYAGKLGKNCISLNSQSCTAAGSVFSLADKNCKSHNFIIPTLGDHNLRNAALVAGYLKVKGVTLFECAKKLTNFKMPDGRLELHRKKDCPSVYIDYAHSPEALKETLLTLQKLMRGIKGELICVFGCGGNRDKTKRSSMGLVASSIASKGYITSDNPREEKISDINREIFSGIEVGNRVKWVEVIDRAIAIKMAIEKSNYQDIILISGKGHENYQIIGKERVPYSDREEVQKALQNYQPNNKPQEI